MGGRLGRAALVAIVIVVLSGAYVLFLAPPRIPDSAASAALTRTVLEGAIAPDMSTEDGAEVPPASPNGQACLPRIEKSTGWLDLCWQAYRNPMDSDPQKDYYVIRAYGSYQGIGVLGIRWLVVQATLSAVPSFNTYDGWPSGTHDGGCQQEGVSLMMIAAPLPTETICGHTTAGPIADGRGWRSEWRCAPCLPFDNGTRGFALYHTVAVVPGAVPDWELAVDFGS